MKVKRPVVRLCLVIVISLFIFIFAQRVWFADREEVLETVALTKIAIVVDDWGYSLKNLPLLFEIDYPLTISILPDVIYSKKVAEAVHKRKNFEIILHLPLEPEDTSAKNLEPSTIYTSMSEEEIISSLDKALKSVPYSLGISNHMGSKATQDRDFMKIIFTEIRRRDLFFLDSLVTEDSICRELSQEMDVRFVQRNIFLDNQDDPAYIKSQFSQLVLWAKIKGSAVGLGHGKETTLGVLKEIIPGLEEQGIRLVHLSQLAK